MNDPFSTKKKKKKKWCVCDEPLNVDESFLYRLLYSVFWGKSGLHRDHIYKNDK